MVDLQDRVTILGQPVNHVVQENNHFKSTNKSEQYNESSVLKVENPEALSVKYRGACVQSLEDIFLTSMKF